MPRKVIKTIYDHVKGREIPVTEEWRTGESLRQLAPHLAGFHGLPGGVRPKSEGFGAWLYDSNPMPWPFTSRPEVRRRRHDDMLRDSWDEVMSEVFGNVDETAKSEPLLDTLTRLMNDTELGQDRLKHNHKLMDAITRNMAPRALEDIRSKGRKNALKKAAGAAATAGLLGIMSDEDR